MERLLHDLHVTQGYVVLRGVLKEFVNEEAVIAIRALADAEAERIFNGGEAIREDEEDAGDGKRLQAPLEGVGRLQPLVREIRTAMRKKLLELFPEHRSRDFVALRSDEGCAEQPAHIDYLPKDFGVVVKETETDISGYISDERMPLACVLCLEEETTLDVWPWAFGKHFWDNRNSRFWFEKLELSPGDMIIFRGDLVHGGSAYDVANLRLHCYLDHKDTKRTPNRTFYMDQDPRVYPREVQIKRRKV